jgi:hypothetical protein
MFVLKPLRTRFLAEDEVAAPAAVRPVQLA